MTQLAEAEQGDWAHCHEVRAYVRDRSSDLPVINVAAGDGWGALCSFLRHKKPAKRFPHTNRGGRRASIVWTS